MKAAKLASVSIDLDALSHYEALHGLPLRSRADAVIETAPRRFAELLEGARSKGTLFAIGKEIPAGAGSLKTVAAAGHEIGNHTLDHVYSLTRGTQSEIQHQVEEGAKAIEAATGTRPVGFRAPGYTLTAELLEVVARTGHRYDSSVFPAAPYYAAKAAVMALRQLQRRPSVAILDRPGVLRAPRQPYRPSIGDPYKKGAGPLVELPLAIDPLFRLPFYGTLVVAAPWPLVKAVYASVRRLPFLNLHIHGVDLMDSSDGIDGAVAQTTPDLAIAASKKLRRLREVLSWLAGDFQIVSLAEAARAYA